MIGIAETIIGVVGNVLDKFVADKSEREKLKAQVAMELLANDQEIIKTASKNVLAEIKGSAFQRNWRPSLMYLIIVIIGLNFLFFPLVELLPFFDGRTLRLDLPMELYRLMEFGVGGYIVGRSGEKIASNMNSGKPI